MMGDSLLWATSAALIIWVGFYLRVLRYRTVRPPLRAALMAGHFEHCTPDGNVPAIVGPDGRVSLRARRLFRVARVRARAVPVRGGQLPRREFQPRPPPLATRGMDGHHHPGRRSRGCHRIKADPLPTLGPRHRRHRSARLPRTRHHHQRRRPGRLESRQQPHTRSDLHNRPRTATDELA